MSISTSPPHSPPSGRASSGNKRTQAGDADFGAFDLRDTLSGIVVREGSFHEFLVALKRFGPQASRP